MIVCNVHVVYTVPIHVVWTDIFETRGSRRDDSVFVHVVYTVPIHVVWTVCTVSILWNFHTNPYNPSETTS